MSNRPNPAIRIVAIRQPFALFELRPWLPPLNIYETEHGFQIVAELAGTLPDDLQVSVHPTGVRIRGVRHVPTPASLRRLLQMEIASSPFEVEVPLGGPVDPDHAEAQYANGLLSVWLPFATQIVPSVVVIRLGDRSAG
jgi:HSP20 family molecular chaperone IbpA